MRQVMFLMLVLVFMAGCVRASFAAAPMQVHVAIGKVSEVVLPEKAAKVIKGGAADSVLVEVLDNSIYLLPKTNTPADVFITGVSGESYPLNLVIAPEHDVRVQINGSSVHRLQGNVKNDVMDLMKEILLKREPAGATVIKGGREIPLKDSRINLTVEVVYDFPHMAAYILKASNTTDNSVIVPVQQITFPNLLAVASDSDLLKPKGQNGDATSVYLIAEK